MIFRKNHEFPGFSYLDFSKKRKQFFCLNFFNSYPILMIFGIREVYKKCNIGKILDFRFFGIFGTVFVENWRKTTGSGKQDRFFFASFLQKRSQKSRKNRKSNIIAFLPEGPIV